MMILPATSTLYDIDLLPTMILPAISVKLDTNSRSERQLSNEVLQDETTYMEFVPRNASRYDTSIRKRLGRLLVPNAESPLAPVVNLIKTSGLYALSSVAPSLVSLVLAPLLTHNISPTDYGVLTIINLFISLSTGISQLGLPSAFFRAYGYDYTSSSDQRDVLATVTTLLCLVSIPMTIGVSILSSFLAQLLFNQSALGSLVTIAGAVILLQNLTVPGFALLRAEGRALFYSLLSIGNLLITLIATIVLIVVFHLGIAGALLANGCGYAGLVVYMLPMTLLRAGIRIRADIARSLLTFGIPLVFNFLSYWILQLSDRYLLSFFDSLAQTAMYSVAYTMGSVINVLVISPFTLAWPTAMFAIAKREDATQVFKLVFRWFSLFLLFFAFALSLVGMALLDILFPVAYRSSIFVIPVVAESIVFYGVYYVFMIGTNIKRKTWLAAVFTTIAAIINVGLNLILIPLYGPMGAAVSTLLAYIVLALVAYVVNQKLYHVSYEIIIFIVALVLGVFFFLGSALLGQTVGTYLAWGISLLALCLYSVCLAFLVKILLHSHKNEAQKRTENNL